MFRAGKAKGDRVGGWRVGYRAGLTHLLLLYLQKRRVQLYQEEKANCEDFRAHKNFTSTINYDSSFY